MNEFIQRLMLYLPALGNGLLVTLGLCLVAMLLGFALGVALYLCSSSRSRALVWFSRVYVSFFRGTPLLAQLLLCFYLPTSLDIDLPGVVAAIVVLSLNTAAYQSQILRSGFEAIPKGQLEAAGVFGLSRWQTLTRVQIPQVLQLASPALVSELIDVIKASAVVSVVAMTDLMRVSQQLVAQTYRPLEVYLVAALFYLALTSVLALAGRALEQYWQRRA